MLAMLDSCRARSGGMMISGLAHISAAFFRLAMETRVESICFLVVLRAMGMAELGPLEIRQVRRTAEEGLFGRLMQAHHYLRYRQSVG